MMRVLLAACLLLFAARAAAAGVVVTDHAESALYPVEQGFAPGATTWFVFEQRLQGGWHVYWKNPGDSGLPLEINWRLPEGYVAGDVIYPSPERIPVGPLANFGHHGAPAFLVPVTAPADAAPGAMVEIGATATWLICEEICVPEEGDFALALPVTASPPVDPAAAAVAEKARAAAPEPFAADARFEVKDGEVYLSLAAPERAPADAYFFPEFEGLIEPAAPQEVERRGGRLVIAMKAGFAAGDAGDEIRGVLGSAKPGGARGFAITAVRSQEPLAAAAPASSRGAPGGTGGVALLLLGAFFGGVLLNVMPCVFPVIFIKAASLMNSAGASPAAVRRDGALYTAGVVATFALLGGLLLALRAGGEELGWGFHLQSPAIVLLSAYVLFLVGLNLAGVFHVGESLQGVGEGLASKRGAAGAFFTGALAVVVAAPCIGPLLTAPIGAAALLPPTIGMLIFIVMGLGLAAPYLALSLVPRLGAMLPRPGAWMGVFRQALAFPVFAGAAYFLWVLAQQTGSAGLGQALAGALLLALAAWLFEVSKRGGGKLLLRGGALAAALLSAAPLGGLSLAPPAEAATGRPEAAQHGAIPSVAYDPALLESLRAEGRGVFIDFTAAWCVACQFNKLTIFSKPEIARAFASGGAAFMVADWTRRDPAITAALAEFGANGVPLYVYYPPGGEAELLSLPLTARAVVRAVNRSS